MLMGVKNFNSLWDSASVPPKEHVVDSNFETKSTRTCAQSLEDNGKKQGAHVSMNIGEEFTREKTYGPWLMVVRKGNSK